MFGTFFEKDLISRHLRLKHRDTEAQRFDKRTDQVNELLENLT
jgi:hypothetical protein